MRFRFAAPCRAFLVSLAASSAVACASGEDLDGIEDDAPGALVGVRLDSRVGVLLNEVPAQYRDRVADELLAAPDAAWILRAKNQVALTTYRLVFRDFFYDENEGKGQLPLPPSEGWDVALTSEPRRVSVGAHDLVVVDYRLQSTLLTSPESPGEAEPQLARVGGRWEEPFVLPLDPELLFQRTGYACMDESEYPPNSVDGENSGVFYDYECEAGENDCHVTEVPDESCIEALDRAVGSHETVVEFERLPWSSDLADEVRIGEVTNHSGSDLEVIGSGLDNHRVVYRYIAADSCAVAEGCVTETGWRRLLQFDASVKNVGAEAIHIGAVDYYLEDLDTELANHNLFLYSECHEHYHFSHYGTFVYTSGADALGNKQAFCLQSTNRYSNNEASPLTHPYGSCAFQGIQAGWGDDYGAGIECQWIDVTDVDVTGAFARGDLTFEANPDRFLCEGSPVLDANQKLTFEPTEFVTEDGEPVDRFVCEELPDWNSNNEQSRPVQIPATGGLITTECSRGQIGPLRDCGFADMAVSIACPVGGSVRLRCSGSADVPAVVRVCEYSQVLGTGVACVFREALANTIVDGANTAIDVECPPARDTQEVGGAVSLYAAPLLVGTNATVSCSPEPAD